MDESLPIWIAEPASQGKARQTALKANQPKMVMSSSISGFEVEALKQKLLTIRNQTLDNLESLVECYKDTVSHRFPQLQIHHAADAASAISYIRNKTQDIHTVSTNNSSAIAKEILPGLSESYEICNRYRMSPNLDVSQGRDYWEVPFLIRNNIKPSFEITKKYKGLVNVNQSDLKKYAAILGVAGAAADDGTILFLQHRDNISSDLVEAGKVFVVLPIDKIYSTREEAELVTTAMGIFGMESVVLALGPHEYHNRTPFEVCEKYSAARELHLILLDNGRSRLSQSEYRDLLLCIHCRGCLRQCPIGPIFTTEDPLWSPHSYASDSIGSGTTTRACIHCEACRSNCPLDIKLPDLMWQARDSGMTKDKRPLNHVLLGSPELIARSGTVFSPLSNWVLKRKWIRVILDKLIGINSAAPLPEFHRKTLRTWVGKREDTHER